MQRCYYPKHDSYAHYNALGITVYEPWHDVKTFIEWIEANLGPRPTGHTLDRINGHGNYEPGNLRWADAWTQNNNKPHLLPRPTYEEIISDIIKDGA